MFREMDRTDNERSGSQPEEGWLAGLMACYDWTVWQPPDCPETDAPPADETGREAIMRYYNMR